MAGLMYPIRPLVGHFFFCPLLRAMGTHPGWQWLCSHSAHFWATFDFLSCSKALGTPQDGSGYVAFPPTCGPLLILFPSVKRWRPPSRQQLCNHSTHLWATADFVPLSEALGTP